MKLALLLGSIACSVAAFLTIDWFRTERIQRTIAAAGKPTICAARDSVRDHALKPNCASIEHWGRNSYEFFTNNLGFRDARIRDVPLADSHPRILMLGDSFTEGMLAWSDSYVGKIAAGLPQYDFLNGGVASYSPSNYLNVARMVLAKGVAIDEVIVFLDISDVADEAAFYRDADASGAVTGPGKPRWVPKSWYMKARAVIASHFLLTSDLFEFCSRVLVSLGYPHVTTGRQGDPFDMELSAWTYRKVNETESWPGYAPLGVEGGIAKEKAKMTLLWQELKKHGIPISVVVYPYPAQVVYDTVDSRQVRIWREWCAGKCQRFISLFPAFFEVKASCPPSRPGCWYLSLFIFGDAHYAAPGNALVADAVIKNLREDQPVKVQAAWSAN